MARDGGSWRGWTEMLGRCLEGGTVRPKVLPPAPALSPEGPQSGGILRVPWVGPGHLE